MNPQDLLKCILLRTLFENYAKLLLGQIIRQFLLYYLRCIFNNSHNCQRYIRAIGFLLQSLVLLFRFLRKGWSNRISSSGYSIPKIPKPNHFIMMSMTFFATKIPCTGSLTDGNLCHSRLSNKIKKTNIDGHIFRFNKGFGRLRSICAKTIFIFVCL